MAIVSASIKLACYAHVQTRIAEYIRQKNVEENFESAMEFNPEVFAQVTMLYVNMDVGISRFLKIDHVQLCSLTCKGRKTKWRAGIRHCQCSLHTLI